MNLQMCFHDYFDKESGGLFFLPPAILKRVWMRKFQNLAVKSNSENRFTLIQKNSEFQSISYQN